MYFKKLFNEIDKNRIAKLTQDIDTLSKGYIRLEKDFKKEADLNLEKLESRLNKIDKIDVFRNYSDLI